jgi:hypothetical protein
MCAYSSNLEEKIRRIPENLCSKPIDGQPLLTSAGEIQV